MWWHLKQRKGRERKSYRGKTWRRLGRRKYEGRANSIWTSSAGGGERRKMGTSEGRVKKLYHRAS